MFFTKPKPKKKKKPTHQKMRDRYNPVYHAPDVIKTQDALEVFSKEGEGGILRRYGWSNTKDALAQIFYLKALAGDPIDAKFCTQLIYLYLNLAALQNKGAKDFAVHVRQGYQMALAQLKEDNKVTQAEFKELENKFEKVTKELVARTSQTR